MVTTVTLLASLLSTSQATLSPDPPLVLEVVDANGTVSALPVLRPPRERYVILSAPPLSDGRPEINEPRLKAVAVRTYVEDGEAIAELLLILRGVPDLEKTLERYELRDGDAVVARSLTRYGLKPLTIRAHRVDPVTTPAPDVEPAGPTLATTVQALPGAVPAYRIRFHNTSLDRAVLGMWLGLDFGGRDVVTFVPRGRRGQPLLGPGGTAVEGMEGHGQYQEGAFRPAVPRRLVVRAVVFDDGTFEGAAGPADEILCWTYAEAWQIGRVLGRLNTVEIVNGAPGIPSLQAAHDSLARLPWDAAEVTLLQRTCASCTKFPPSTLRNSVQSATDTVMEDLEGLIATTDDGPRALRWHELLAEYAAWRRLIGKQ